MKTSAEVPLSNVITRTSDEKFMSFKKTFFLILFKILEC